MLADFDATLRELLVKRVPLDPNQVDISFECPTRAWSARVLKPTLSLYLFDLRQNTTYGQKSGQPAMPLPPTYFDLSYFITAWAPTVIGEHRLLWSVMMTLLRETMIGPDLLQGELQKFGPPVKLTTAQWDGVLKRPGELWEALDNVVKPAVTYTATLSLVLQKPPPPAGQVLTKMIVTESMMRTQKESLVAIGGIVRTRPVEVVNADGAEGAEGGEGAGSPPPPPPQRAVANAEVTFPQLGISVRSDSDGRYVVRKIPQGTHRVQVVTTAGDTSEAEITVPAPNYNLEV